MSAELLLEQVESLRRSEPAQALQLLEREFARAARSASDATRGSLWRTRGHVLRSLRRTREACRAYQRAASAFAAAGDSREEGRCAIGLVDALMYLGRTADARLAATRGRRLLSRSGDTAALARLLNNEGNLLHRLDLPERALTCYRAAVRALERAGDRRSALMVSANVGNCLSLLGRLDEARRHYRAARKAQLDAGAHNEALAAEYNLAYLDFLEHRDEDALDGLSRVRAEAESHGYPSLVALARLDRAEILLRLGSHTEALQEADSAVAACAALDLQYESAKAELFAALARFRLGRPDAARRGIERALARFDAQGNDVWAGEALLGMATIWRQQGNSLAAAALLAAARLRFAASGDREREASAATLESRARHSAGESRAARAALARAMDLRGRRPSPRLEHLLLGARATLARASGDLAEARRLLRRAAARAEQLAARILDEEWRSTFWGEWGWPHRDLAMLELEHGDPTAALEALEAGRGRVLVGVSVARGTRGRSLPASVRRWTASRQAREREPRRSGDTVSVDRTPPSVLTRRATSVVRAPALRHSLPRDSRLIDYLECDGVLGALVVSRDHVVGAARLATSGHVTQLAHRALFALRSAAFSPRSSRTGDAALDETLAEVAAAALWPLLGRDLPSALAVAPVGALGRLPWAALPLPDGRALCQALPLVVVPGVRLTLGDRGVPGTGRPLLVAVDGGDLDAVAHETAAVRSVFPDAELLAGDDATAERFIALAPSAAWIHFAGHGAYRPDAPMESGIRLADRWLLAGELAALSLSARWVTLSACHTARALVQPGEEWFGLARSFLLAGAHSVVAAQWDVEDAPTASFMAGLYARLAQGQTVPCALAAEQASHARALTHPLEWAGFVAMGGPSLLRPGHRSVEPPVGRSR